MDGTGPFTLILILINFAFTYRGLRSPEFFSRYCLDVPLIHVTKDYKRIITAGFLHVSWMHFIFNAIALYSFGSLFEQIAGEVAFITVYASSLIISHLLSLIVHKDKAYYTAAGASGAISGIVFACIVLFPTMKMSLLFIPIHIPAWIFGIMYMLYCMFGMRSQRDNIGHDAHLSGGVAGILTVAAFYPSLVLNNSLITFALVAPSAVFFYLAVTKTTFLLADKPFATGTRFRTIDDKYHDTKQMKEEELDALLEKISSHGINSLSKKEKARLEELSKVQ